MSSNNRAREALQKHFGFSDFLEGQAEVIDSVLAGENAVVVMPTGGGKSLCYQLPAMMLDGVTLVVSPLIALMKDQVDALTARDIPTTFINSSLGYAETNKRLSEIRRGVHALVYVAPERFRSGAFMEAIGGVTVRLFARLRESRMKDMPARNSLESRLSSQLVVSLRRTVLVVLAIP